MPKKRRKLNPDFEKKISSASKQVELINAKINDIRDEDIQSEYKLGFQPSLKTVALLSQYYKQTGFNEEAQQIFNDLEELISTFISEYEI